MAYTYKKLTDVELVDSAVEPNLLIEDGGDIKKISASNIAVPQVKADWDETDINSPAFILNKPTSIGGGANVVTYAMSYTIGSGTSTPHLTHGVESGHTVVTAQEVVDAWDSGSILRINDIDEVGSVLSINYSINSGVTTATVYYIINSSIASVTL